MTASNLFKPHSRQLQAAILWYWPYYFILFLGYLRGLCPSHLSKQKFEIPTSSLLKDGTRFSSSECAAASAKFSLQDQKYEICALEEKEIPCFPARSSTGILVWTLQNLPGAVIMDFESFGMVKLEVT